MHHFRESESTVAMSDADAGRNARCNRRLESLNVSGSDSNYSIPSVGYKDHEKDKELKAILFVYDHRIEALDFQKYRLANTSSW